MDIYNTKEIGKKSKINDEYWYEAWFLSRRLLVAVRNNNNQKIMQLLRDPRLFKGRA
jgi:hypothetical protein